MTNFFLGFKGIRKIQNFFDLVVLLIFRRTLDTSSTQRILLGVGCGRLVSCHSVTPGDSHLAFSNSDSNSDRDMRVAETGTVQRHTKHKARKTPDCKGSASRMKRAKVLECGATDAFAECCDFGSDSNSASFSSSASSSDDSSDSGLVILNNMNPSAYQYSTTSWRPQENLFGRSFTYRGGGVRDGNISSWDISYFKCVRNFLLNSQATVRNGLVSKFSHLGVSPPHPGLGRVLLPVALVEALHQSASG